MLKKIYRSFKEINFVIVISIVIISILFSTGLAKILNYRDFQFFANNKFVNLSSSVEYFIPQGIQNPTINQVTNNFENKFTKANLKSIYFPEDVKKVWLKLKLHGNQADIENVIYIDCEFIENIEIYIPITDNKFISVKPKEYFIFPYIDLPENTDFNKDIYINLTWDSNVFNLFLAKDSDFYINQNLLTCFYVGNLGVLLGMIIMNLVLFFSSKDSKYLFHSFFTGSLLLLLYCLSGMQRLIFGFTSNNRLIAFGAMAALAWILFIYSYLDIKNNMPMLNKYFRISIAFFILSLFVSEIIPNGFTYDILYLYLFITGLSIIVSIHSYLKFNMGSIYYLIGIFILFTGFTIYILASCGLLAWNIITFSACYPAASIETLLFTIGIIKQIKTEKEKNNKLQMEAFTDKLTNLYNRRYFEDTVMNKIIELNNERSTVSMLILDIDRFKNVNDTYGHDAGDSVLAEVAMLIKQCLRKEDILVRWGGEEFVVILPLTNAQEGTIIAERMRTNIENHIFKYVKKTTISIGVAEKTIEESFEDWFRRVDNAMYKAKEGGRNMVCVCYLNGIYMNEK